MALRQTEVRVATAVLAVASLVAVGACTSDDAAGPLTTPTETPTSPTTVPPTTGPSDTTPSDTSTPAAVPDSTEPPPTACEEERDQMLAAVDESIEAARLAPGSGWSEDTDGVAFDDRTQSAEEFGYRLGLACVIRLAQATPSGDERLLLAAWTGDRRAWVLQATDAPESAYRPDQRVQLFIDQPYGEWLVDQAVWAGSLETGETVIVGVVDTSFGVAAKSWWAEVPRFEDLEVTNDAERYAIDTLLEAGARNVSVAEPADFRSEIAAIQFITPLGLHLIATIAPPDLFDPAAALVEGEMTVEDVGGVDVYVTAAVPDSYAVGSVGWTCGDYVWFIDSTWGTLDELTDWTAQLIESAGC